MSWPLVVEVPNVYRTTATRNLKAPEERNVCSMGHTRSAGAKDFSPHMFYKHFAALRLGRDLLLELQR
jgi:hypothetical protein